MQTVSDVSATKNVTATAQPAEVRKLILKLRWIAMEEEADRLSESLARAATIECPLMGPRDTD